MTKSSTSTAPKTTQPASSSGWFSSLLVVIFRLLLLGVGGVSAGLVGVAIATVAPGNIEDPPALEILFRQFTDTRNTLQRYLNSNS